MEIKVDMMKIHKLCALKFWCPIADVRPLPLFSKNILNTLISKINTRQMDIDSWYRKRWYKVSINHLLSAEVQTKITLLIILEILHDVSPISTISSITKLYPVRVISPNCMKTVSVSTDNCNNPLPGENTTSCHSTSSSRTSDEPLSSDHSLTNYCVCVIITIVSVVVRQDAVLWWHDLTHWYISQNAQYGAPHTRQVGGCLLYKILFILSLSYWWCTFTKTQCTVPCTVEWFTFLASRLLLTRCQVIGHKSATSHAWCFLSIGYFI